MARYKRYFPVSHDINRDPDIHELVKQFGAPGLRIWLEILSIADRTENRVKINNSWLETVCKLVCNRFTNALQTVNKCVANGWLLPNKPFEKGLEIVYEVANYAEYHRTSARNDEQFGDENEKIGVPPNLTKPNKNKIARSVALSKPSLRSVEEKSAEPEARRILDNPETAEPENKPPRSPDDYAPMAFDDLWDAWPKQEGYTKAKKAWNKLRLPKEIVDKIFSDLPYWRRNAGWAKDGGRYCRKLETYLLEAGWKDNPPKPRIIG